MDALIADVHRVHSEVTSLQDKIQKFVTDKSVPISDRWSLYREACRKNIITKNESYGDGYITIFSHDICLFDDLCFMERRETMGYVTLYDIIKGAIEDGDLDGSKMEEWMEEVLASGCASFTYDW